MFLIVSSQHAERQEASRQITNAVSQQLISSCTDCNDIIDMQSLDCGSESVIIYRARLEGTSQRDSSSFINIIEAWVTSGPILIVTELLMTVDSQCTVVISSLIEGDCTQSIIDTTANTTTIDTNNNTTLTPTTSNSSIFDNAAMIGGVVAVVIVIVIVVVAVIVLVIKSCQGHGDAAVKKQ